MKKIILLFVAIISLNMTAQKELKEGVISMKMTMSTDNEQAKASLAMMGDISVTTYFKGQKSRTEQSHQMTGNNVSIVDNDAKKMVSLMNNPMLGKKYLTQELSKSVEELENIKVTATGETKKVLDYDCKGYDIVAIQNGQELKMKMFVTEKITAKEQYTSMLGGKLKGFPMYMVLSVNQMGMAMDIITEVTELKAEKVDDSKFDMTIPEGYTKMEMPKPATVD